MESNDTISRYFIRSRGKVMGPFTVERLKTLHARGQFSRVHEVSTDRKSWQPASMIEGLMEAVRHRKQQESLDEIDVAIPDEFATVAPAATLTPPTAESSSWHYHVAGQQFGPVSLGELRSLVRSGRLSAGDLVWHDSFPDWTPLGEVDELASEPRPPRPVSAAPVALGAHQIFCFSCGATIHVRAELCPRCGVRQRGPVQSDRKNRVTAALLALVLGGIGAHHFYLGQPLLGILYLLFCWTFIPAIIALVEFIIYLCMSDESFDAKYNRR